MQGLFDRGLDFDVQFVGYSLLAAQRDRDVAPSRPSGAANCEITVQTGIIDFAIQTSPFCGTKGGEKLFYDSR